MGVAISGQASGLAHFFDLRELAGTPPVKSQSTEVLDRSHHLMLEGRVSDGMDLLAGYLLALRGSEDAGVWEQFSRTVLHHPVGKLVWQDPFTFHSFRKPRGYAGDACLLDYIYGRLSAPGETSALGRRIFDYMVAQLGARSVRSRGEILARIIDETAGRVRAPRILSIACGHLREAAGSKALADGRIGEFLAFDQDPESLAEVDREFGAKGVRTVLGSVRSVLAGKVSFEGLDLVYAAGLYDYLSDRVASRLTRLMFDMLAPGGRLIVANFAPCLPEAGYMESFMSWKLIYRQPREFHALARDIADDEWSWNRLFWDEHESIIFLDLKKRQPRVGLVKPADGPRFIVPGLRNVTTPTGRRVRKRAGGANGPLANGSGPDGHAGADA